MTRQSVLHAVHAELGASFTDFAGWSMPLRYSSEVTEHLAVRSAAGMFDLSHMGEIAVSGPEAGRALDYALTGRPSRIAVGRARYMMMCHETGGILDDLVVYRLAEDEYLVVANASNALIVLSLLRDRFDGYVATVRDATDDWALVAVQGPLSPDIVDRVTDANVAALKYYAIDPAALAGHGVLLARTGYTGEDGFEIYCAPAAAPEVWRALSAAGAEHGLVPAGLASRDSLRLEAGMPLYGQELTVRVTPFEAGLGRVVTFDKPRGFVGESALLARRTEGQQGQRQGHGQQGQRQQGQGQRQLVGLACQGRRSPRTGYRVLDAETHAHIGEVTSGIPSPTLSRPIAMAYVPMPYAEPGTRLAVDVRGNHVDAEVVALPFYRRAS